MKRRAELEERRTLRLYAVVALSPASMRGAFGTGFAAPHGTPPIMGGLTEYDGLAVATLLGPANEEEQITGIEDILGHNAIFMVAALRELAQLHDYYPGIPQVYADFEDLTDTLGCWVAVSGTIEIVVPSPNSNEQCLPKHPKWVERSITIEKSKLLDASSSKYRILIEELPVVSIQGARVGLMKPPNNLNRGLSSIWPRELLRVWQDAGCVCLLNRDRITEVVPEAFTKATKEDAEAVIDFWIGQGVFRQEGKWLVPLAPILSCASDEQVAEGVAWQCLVKGHQYVEIKIE